MTNDASFWLLWAAGCVSVAFALFGVFLLVGEDDDSHDVQWKEDE